MSFWSDFIFWPESIIASFLKSFENFINERPSRGNAIEKKKYGTCIKKPKVNKEPQWGFKFLHIEIHALKFKFKKSMI